MSEKFDFVEDLKMSKGRAETLSGENIDGEKLSFTLAGFTSGITGSLPLILSGIPFGLVFGLMARQTSLSLFEAASMSATVFAGTAQLVALGQWHEPLPVFGIAFTTFLVNLRLILMGASLRPWFEKLTPLQAYGSMLFLTDGSWALQLQDFKEDKRNGAFLLGSGVAQHFEWVCATVLGFALGAVISSPEKWGLDFVVPASFLALLVGMWRGKTDILPWIVAAIASLVSSKLLSGNWFILVGGLAGSLAGALINSDITKGDNEN